MVSRSIVHGGSKKKAMGVWQSEASPHMKHPLHPPWWMIRGSFTVDWSAGKRLEISDIWYIYINIYIYTLWLFNITMGKSPFLMGKSTILPIWNHFKQCSTNMRNGFTCTFLLQDQVWVH
jgi:hypothetical protein